MVQRQAGEQVERERDIIEKTAFLHPSLLCFLDSRQMKRVGFVDRVKQEGPLPRLQDDSKAIVQTGEYRVTNNWAQHRALHGQNDYIDILGGPTLYMVSVFYILF